MHKLGIITPYRNRPIQLVQFLNSIRKYIENISYELIVVEQKDNEDFNRGKLLNIGFLKAEELGCDYVIFHDVDMVPLDVDYSYSDIPLQLATNFKLPPGMQRITLDEYFGGVTLFPSNLFRQINGYSNQYAGWGFEDDDLLLRCKENNLDLNYKPFKPEKKEVAALEFNGKNSYVRLNNKINFTKPFSIFVSCCPYGIQCNEEEEIDEYSIFSIPGYDTTLTYNSFKNYKFETWNCNVNCIPIHTENQPAFLTNFVVTINPKTHDISLYQSGNFIESKKLDQRLISYKEQPYIYLGVGDPNRDKQKKHFWGVIDSFAIFNKELSLEEIKSISENKVFGLTSTFDNYDSVENLQVYYDAKFIKDNQLIDLSENNNNGYISNCNMVKTPYLKEYKLVVPHKRQSTFEILPHQENGFKDNSWAQTSTRKNQINFYNKLNNFKSNYQKDGLTTCLYKSELKNINGYYHLIAEI